MRAYIDSDILIWHLRGEQKALRFLQKLKNLKEYELWVGAAQRAEIAFFMRSREEEDTMLFLSQFKTAPIDESIIHMASMLFRSWNKSHGIDVNDAILTATALLTNGKIYCLNIKHYPMPGLLVEKAW